MSTAARKARKRAGIPYSKPQKTATRPYESRRDGQVRRAKENRAVEAAPGYIGSLVRAVSSAMSRFRGGNR